ncbi:MAG TPA: adenosylmethionine--8-amino-7-oxononanoate transaminase [Chthoniobacterales bacterium]|nr:adenosylmethionine--8-amino-7-oxononanoate transaminase [Chthoniobacterales bacterium]
MSNWDTAGLMAADKRYLWHPFTAMHDWCAPGHEPLVLVEGHGAILRDSRGQEYIDGNSSIWTNIHGHNHPRINAAIRGQLDLVAHTSFLGFTNPPAIELARSIVELFPPNTLSRVFFSDDGSTGIEVALRIADQHWRWQGSERRRFIAFKDAYHGDTAGAASLGAAAMFQNGTNWNFPAIEVRSVVELEALPAQEASEIAAVVIEPMVQGAAGIKLWPPGTLAAVRSWCDRAGVLLIADEVLTGFGRTGEMFACQHEGVMPDMMILAKGLTGGYLPLAITLTTEQIFSMFCHRSCPENTLFYGHSYTGNALACAAAKASLEIFDEEHVLVDLALKIETLRTELATVREMPQVVEVRQCGFIAGVEVRSNPADAGPGKLGAAICLAARRHGLLTRPIRDVIVLMPPYCITPSQLQQAVRALAAAIAEVGQKTVPA